jgi:dynein heavy chain, axonemal
VRGNERIVFCSSLSSLSLSLAVSLPLSSSLTPSRSLSNQNKQPTTKNSFYFVSDPVLLEILSLGSDPPSVVPHLQSGLFDAVASAAFDSRPAEARTRIVELISPQGEKLRLEGSGVDARGAGAEVWLQRLVDGMRAAVRGSIRRAARDVQAVGAAGVGAGGAAAAFVFGAPAQAALLGLQLLWTADVQGALAAARAGDRAAVGRAFRRADALLR